MNKRFRKGLLIAGVLVILFTGILITGCQSLYVSKGSSGANEKVDEKLDYLKAYIDKYYLEDVNEEELEDGIYKGFLSGLGDPYSTYYTKEEYEQLLESQSGTYCGIGVGVSQDTKTGVIVITKVYEGTPAKEAGIQQNDLIYKVAGEDISGKTLDEVVAQIKGKEGTKVDITVYRTEGKKYVNLKVERKTISIPTVEYKMMDTDNKIGYIKIDQFDELTAKQFKSAIKELQNKGMKSVVFDVRNNPGGLYHIVCEMLDAILPQGTLVYTVDKDGKKEEEKSDKKFLDIPMTVLINENSASAAEIFAGAIQDFKAGEIIGKQSFGKGIVQNIFKLNDGSAIKLTVSKYYTPNGVNIHGKGITPDIEVENDSNSKEDAQLNKALEELKK